MIERFHAWRPMGLVFLLLAATAAAQGPVMDMAVDATDLPRRLLHTRMEIPAQPGRLALWYPKWVPGIHAPGGPIENVAGLRVETPDGGRLEWKRDETEYHRVFVEVPAGVPHVVVHMDYICNQPSTNSIGVDSFGYPLLGIINWNTCLVYPEGHAEDALRVRLRVRFPEAWRFATAMKRADAEPVDGWSVFEETTLRTVVDSPLIAGEFLRSYPLEAGNGPPAFLHLVSESQAAIQADDEVIAAHMRLMREAYALFGGAPFEEYHFLLALSDAAPGIGLEHLRSSLNAVPERDLIDKDKRKERVAYLLPHEGVHAWIGKFRRPAGMATNNYHDPMRTSLLWVYEGLAQYLGEVLMVRAGFVSFEDYLQRFAMKVVWLMTTEGRTWRPLEDTAAMSGPLRGRSQNWAHWRRSQDYYNEGLLIWLEIDAMIREASNGEKSLDDFCKRFVERQGSGIEIDPFELEDITALLNEFVERDWAAFFDERVAQPQERLPLDFIGLLGFTAQYANNPSDAQKKLERDRGSVSMLESIGMEVRDGGGIAHVEPGSLADDAGLAPGVTILGINDRKYSRERLHDAVAESVARGGIGLLLQEGDSFRSVTIDYADGPKFFTLVRDSDKPERLKDILSPVTKD